MSAKLSRLIDVPGAEGRRIATPVSLMDLGPTILDILRGDPKELENLVDRDDEEARRRISILREFFSIHRNKREGYEVPYRK